MSHISKTAKIFFSEKLIERTDEKAINFSIKKNYIRSFTRSWDIRGYPKNFGSHVTRSRPFFEKNNHGLLLRLSRRIVLPNFTFVALPIPKILGGTFKILGITWPGPRPFFRKNNQGDLFSLSLCIPNFILLALSVPEILGGTLKNLGVTWQGHAHFSGKIIKGICLDFHYEYAHQILHS